MKGTYAAITSALILVAVLGGIWYFFGKDVDFGAVRPDAISGGLYTGAPLSADYRNSDFRFALDTPEGFTAGELPEDENGGRAIILQDTEGNGIQIYITPDVEDRLRLTADDIRASIPGMRIDSPEPVEIGNRYTGVAFLSDNEAFGGASREVWFYFRGNLYQISTYARLDGLLKAMFATWTFY